MESSITIQYFSDTHLEMMTTFGVDIPVIGDVLVLAGDIGCIREPLTCAFLAKMCTQFKDVVYITGNHEYYQTGHTAFSWTVKQIDVATEEFCSKIPNLHFLNKTSWVHPNGQITFHGCCLWSNVPPESENAVELNMNDYNFIYVPDPSRPKSYSMRQMTVKDSNALFADQFNWLNLSIANSKTPKNVVVTHHLPTYELNPDKYKGNELNSAFCTDLSKFIEERPQINAWVC